MRNEMLVWYNCYKIKNLIYRCKKIVYYNDMYCNVHHAVLTNKSMVQDLYLKKNAL